MGGVNPRNESVVEHGISSVASQEIEGVSGIISMLSEDYTRFVGLPGYCTCF